MEEDPLKAYMNTSGINGGVFEALQGGGDVRSLIWGVLSQMNPNPDSPLAAVMGLLLAKNSGLPFGTTGQNEGNGQLAGAQATLRRVAAMLGACPTCCGEESSCPACHGHGGPGRFPSIASAEELGDWLSPALDRMGMHIMHRVILDDSPQ
jgi:hypothetical protein